MRTEEEIRESIKWLQSQKGNKQVAWSMEIALKYALGEVSGLSFPTWACLPDEEEFRQELEKAPEGVSRSIGWMLYGIMKAYAGAKRGGSP